MIRSRTGNRSIATSVPGSPTITCPSSCSGKFAVGSTVTPCAVLEKFAAVQMVDVHLPTTDGREIVMARHTQPEKDLHLLLDQLNQELPAQGLPKIHALK